MFKRLNVQLIATMDGTHENLLTAKKAFWKRRESNLSGSVSLILIFKHHLQKARRSARGSQLFGR